MERLSQSKYWTRITFAGQTLRYSPKRSDGMILVRHAVPADLPHLSDIAKTSATAAHWSNDEYANLIAPEAVQERITLVIQPTGLVPGFFSCLPPPSQPHTEK